MKKRFIKLLLTLSLVLLLSLGLLASLGAGNAPPRKIVVFQDSYRNLAAQQALLDRFGSTLVKPLPIINGWAVLLPPKAEAAMGRLSEVLRIDDDVQVSALSKPTPVPQPPEALPWGVDRIDAELAWPTSTGAGVKVAIIDTGIDLKHPDLKVYGGINTINTINPRKSANDDNGHGTHVAGIVAALDNTIGVVGVAPQAHLYAVKVLSSTGTGFLSDVIEGIQWAVQNGMQVINLSLGTNSDVQSFHDAIIAAYNAGIVIVAAAGNDGAAVDYPAAYPEAIAVTATDGSNTIASWSSRGPEVDLTAPGVDILSTYKGGTYKTLSGTSMASPHVAGTAALVIATGVSDANGDGRINDEVAARLTATADDLGDTGWDGLYGHGLVDAEEAATGVQTNP